MIDEVRHVTKHDKPNIKHGSDKNNKTDKNDKNDKNDKTRTSNPRQMGPDKTIASHVLSRVEP